MKQELQKEYRKCSTAVKRNIMEDKHQHIEKFATNAQTATGQKDNRGLYKKTRQLAGNINDLPLKDRNDVNLYIVDEQLKRWHKYFLRGSVVQWFSACLPLQKSWVRFPGAATTPSHFFNQMSL